MTNTSTITVAPTTTNDANASLTQTIEAAKRGAAMAYAPDVYPTAPCLRGWSVGGSASPGGFSFGKDREIPGCVERELVRMAAQMGMTDHARYLWCNQDLVVATFGTVEVCMQFGAKIDLTQTQAPPDCSVVEQQLVAANERFERAVEVCSEDKGE